MSDHKSRLPFPDLSLSRRGFLTAAAVAAAGGGIVIAAGTMPQSGMAQPVSGGSGGGTTQGTRVRRNIYALAGNAEGQKVIEAYAKGVKEMMARPLSDVRSWRFQAAIHVPRSTDLVELSALPVPLQMYLDPTNLCQHGNLRFLPWHRMYLYFFERILRKACGDPSFTLPYWNYSDSQAERILPPAFRLPADPATNPLYRSERISDINAGRELAATTISTSDAFAQTTPGRSASRPGFYTQVEFRPHNIIHVGLGGEFGLMSDPETAALDPIFWMHHCNIDRLWKRWIRAGHTNLTEAAFLDRVHRFWDEDGNLVEMTTREVMDTATRLDYRYDDETAVEAGVVILADAGVEAGPVATELAASAQPLALSRQAVTTTASPLVEAGGTEVFATRTEAQKGKPVILTLQDISFAAPPKQIFEVYVNPPENEDYINDPAYFVGVFAPFMPPREGETYSEAFDITGLITRQIDAGLYAGGDLSVVIVPMITGEDTGVEAGPLPDVVIGRITVSR